MALNLPLADHCKSGAECYNFGLMSKVTPYVDDFLEGMAKSGQTLYSRVIQNVRQMELDPDGLLKSGDVNTSIIAAISGDIQNFTDSSTYEGRVDKLMGVIPKVAPQLITAARNKFAPGTDIPADLVDAIMNLADQYQGQLAQVIDDDAVFAAVGDPWANDAFQIVGQGQSLNDMEAMTRQLQDALVTYYVTKVTTLLELFEREAMALISDTFQVKLWLYAGPDDERCREFCDFHVGKVYNEEEVAALGDDFLWSWDGMIPGTNPSNVATNLGGYNCRHTLDPVK